MCTELQMLAWAIVLGLVQLVLAATLGTQQRGLAWNAGARDGDPKPLTGVAARMDRAWRNFLETFVFFAAAALAIVVTQRGDPQSAFGAQLYFWARVAYVPAYAAGIAYVRTLIWAASMAGLIMLLLPLLHY
ncbi:MAG TPA: MAPEG family protein [Xanthomonadaceae bacterium]|jgi:uncharacterized MAPEG superfamily protein|nr:MAPEG family protein [Xanthomonadaceae bacterium]